MDIYLHEMSENVLIQKMHPLEKTSKSCHLETLKFRLRSFEITEMVNFKVMNKSFIPLIGVTLLLSQL